MCIEIDHLKTTARKIIEKLSFPLAITHIAIF